MHPEAYGYVERFAEGRHFEQVVEFGSKDVNGSVEMLFDCDSYYGIDLAPGRGVDEVADAATWRSATGPVDCIVCCEVLEHSPVWIDIVRNAARNLWPGGCFVMTCATDQREPHSAVDGGPLRQGEYYGNVDPKQFCMEASLAGIVLKHLEVDVPRGDLRAWGRKVDA